MYCYLKPELRLLVLQWVKQIVHESNWTTVADDEILEPLHMHTHWSADITDATIAVHHLKSAPEWATAWSQILTNIETHIMYTAH